MRLLLTLLELYDWFYTCVFTCLSVFSLSFVIHFMVKFSSYVIVIFNYFIFRVTTTHVVYGIES